MLADGRYSAWFKTAMADGVGLIEIADGQMSGRDTVIEYSGRYVQDGDSFKARISTRRHSPGQPALLGIDEIDIEFEGTSKTTTAVCTGKVLQFPHIPLEVVLVKMAG